MRRLVPSLPPIAPPRPCVSQSQLGYMRSNSAVVRHDSKASSLSDIDRGASVASRCEPPLSETQSSVSSSRIDPTDLPPSTVHSSEYSTSEISWSDVDPSRIHTLDTPPSVETRRLTSPREGLPSSETQTLAIPKTSFSFSDLSILTSRKNGSPSRTMGPVDAKRDHVSVGCRDLAALAGSEPPSDGTVSAKAQSPFPETPKPVVTGARALSLDTFASESPFSASAAASVGPSLRALASRALTSGDVPEIPSPAKRPLQRSHFIW